MGVLLDAVWDFTILKSNRQKVHLFKRNTRGNHWMAKSADWMACSMARGQFWPGTSCSRSSQGVFEHSVNGEDGLW